MTDVGIQVDDTNDDITRDLAARLEDAEAMLTRLRRENEDQQKEIATMKAASANTGNRNGSGRNRAHDNGHHTRGTHGNGGQGSHFHKFPPLQTQSYWHGGARGNHR